MKNEIGKTLKRLVKVHRISSYLVKKCLKIYLFYDLLQNVSEDYNILELFISFFLWEYS